MTRKEIQEQRMKNYFIQATKEILKGEGLKSLSVRSIAEKAGYSFATIYNYFKDVKELIFFCVKDFQSECEDYISDTTKNIERGEMKIKAIVTSYVAYFVQYPSVFEIFFIEKLPPSEGKTSGLIISFLDKLCSEEFEYCITNNQYTIEQTKTIVKELSSATLGMLILYLNRNYPATYIDFNDNLKLQLDRIMRKD